MHFIYLLFILFASEHTNASAIHAPARALEKEGIELKQKGLFPTANLVVTEISFVSIYFDVSSKTYLVKVIIAIRNTGTEASGKTQVEAYTKPSNGQGLWKTMGDVVNIPVINPGNSFKSEFSFKENILSVGTISFDFRVKVDPRNKLVELDKTNNYSNNILINPRAY